MEWLIVWALLGVAGGLAIGVGLARRRSHQTEDRARQLESQLATSRQELDSYRHEVVAQFSETARKFQSLNDAYTDLHQQLAKSSSILCGDINGPLLQAPQGHQDLIPAEIRETVEAAAPAEPASAQEEPASAQEEPAFAQEEPAFAPKPTCEQEEPVLVVREPAGQPPPGEPFVDGQADVEDDQPAALRRPAAEPAALADTDPLEPRDDPPGQPQKAAAGRETP